MARGRTDQRGFALLLTIALMGFFAVLTVALLGLTLNSTGLSTLQAQQAKEQRAAESALDTSINAIRGTAIGDQDGENCNSDVPTNVTFDGVAPTVTCTGMPPSGAYRPPAPSDPSLKVIGSGSYAGGLASIQVDGGSAAKVVGDVEATGSTAGQLGSERSLPTGRSHLPQRRSGQ